MSAGRRFLPTVSAQVTAILVLALVLAHALTFSAFVMFGQRAWFASDPLALGGRVSMLARLYDGAADAAAARAVADAASAPDLTVRRVPSAAPLAGTVRADGTAGLVEAVLDQPGRLLRTGEADGSVTLLLRGRDGEDLEIVMRQAPRWRRPHMITLYVSLLVTGIGTLLLAAYAVRWITSPLTAVARAADSYGRGGEETAPERGPREIVQVAVALNGMRRRVGDMIAERTRMLAAVGHDLRTPLTRLRLRAEQVPDPAQREGLVREVSRIDDLVQEVLAYLGEGMRQDVERVEAGSLAATVCDEFADVGHDVAYEGAGRAAVSCRPTALARVLSNLVENAVRHGGSARVSLRREGARVVIGVADGGPGIPPERREEVFEPFRKGDASRGGEGFGLGLSIARSLARGMGGEVELGDAPGGGLLARVVLPAAR